MSTNRRITTAAELDEFFRDFGLTVARVGETIEEMVERVTEDNTCADCGRYGDLCRCEQYTARDAYWENVLGPLRLG